MRKRFLLGGFGLLLTIAAAVPFAHAQDAAEIMLRLDRLEAENRRLTGIVEQAQNQNRRLEDQLRRMQADVDARFQDLGGGKGSRSGPGSAPGAVPGGATPQRRSDAFDPSAQPSAPGAPRPIGQTGQETIQPLAGGPRIPANGITIDENTRPGRSAPGEPLTLPGAPGAPRSASSGPLVPPGPATTSSPGANAPDDFRTAQSALQRGESDAAEMQFREFMRAYPKDRLISEATFGLGESYFQRQRWQEAAEQYLTLATKFPKASRAPEGLLKLGMSLRNMGEREQACGTLAEVGRKYPNASATVRQAVEREQQRSKC
jgi:tol-pal system protein YbgF